MEEHIERLARLKGLLREVLILLPEFEKGQKTKQIDELFQDICKLVFTNDYYLHLWNERILNQLEELFKEKSPNPKIYGQRLTKLSERRHFVQQVNEFFFSVLSNEFSVEGVCNRLSALTNIDGLIPLKLNASGRLEHIRTSKSTSSEKIEAFVEHLKQDLGIDFGETENILRQVIDSIKAREASEKVNTLLINSSSNIGILIPLSILIEPGKGEVHCLVSGSGDFKAAIERARYALSNKGFLSDTDNVLYSLDITEANYSGDSIGLAAAVGMYVAKTKHHIDPYTAFTGNINLDGGQFKIKFVKGIRQKLAAALLNGCRRVFVPKENCKEIDAEFNGKLQINYVTDITEVFLKLQAPLQPLFGDSIQVRKINFIQSYCQDKGWYLSPEEPIQDGLQFTISPPHPPTLKVNIYNTGTNSPKTHEKIELQKFLEELAILDQSKIPIQNINEIFSIVGPELRVLIRNGLDKLRPIEICEEQHCEYYYRFESGKETIIVKQYINGKLQLQGSAGELYKKILDIIISLYNLKNPKAQLLVENYLKYETTEESSSFKKDTLKPLQANIPFPHLGTDESGKGDYFGPMVIAGVWLDEPTKIKLEALEIKDSKLLSDKRCRELATIIRKICNGKFQEIEIMPERYNELYDQFKKEGKNLNHLLAWGHARAIESLLERHPCSHAVADQFGDEKFILSKLMEKGKKIELVQTPKGERYIAVAAASILARDRFLSRMAKLSQEYDIVLPKGASDIVVQPARKIVEKKGIGEIKKVAKLHHKTTQKVLEKT
ncbi:MAG: ribonuclease HIII [Thermodesulfobacteriota bacterium]